MRALAATLFSACAAVRAAAPFAPVAAVAPPSAPAPAPAPTTDRPSGTPDPADNPDWSDPDPSKDDVSQDDANALHGRTLDQAKQWLGARGYHGEISVLEVYDVAQAKCALGTVCDWFPHDFELDSPLQLTISKAKLDIAPPAPEHP